METTFNGDATLHAEWVAGMEANMAADRQEDEPSSFVLYAAGVYDEEQLQSKTGISPRMANILEYIFENLYEPEAKQFALDVTHAIPCGVVLDDAIPPFLHWLMGQMLAETYEGSHGRKAVEQVRELYANGWPATEAAISAIELAENAHELHMKALQVAATEEEERKEDYARTGACVSEEAAMVSLMHSGSGYAAWCTIKYATWTDTSLEKMAEELLSCIRNLTPKQDGTVSEV
jgi:uncharacterized protein YoaH (UPF0181 family)